MNKEECFEYIKQFTSVSVKNVCSDLKINYWNIMNNTASEKTMLKVVNEIKRRIEFLKGEE